MDIDAPVPKSSIEILLKWRKKGKLYREKMRSDCIKAYGNKCECCGEKIERFLTIDRIDETSENHHYKTWRNGSKSKGGQVLYVWLKHHNYPKGFQVLCFNCNTAKFYFGECPHNLQK